NVQIDRALLGLNGGTAADVAESLPAVVLSSRFVARNFWRDPTSGIGYQVQVQMAPEQMKSKQDLEMVPIHGKGLLRDFATVSEGTMPGQYDRYNMRRVVSMTANVRGEDLGRVAGHIDTALKEVGAPPAALKVDVRGQIAPMRQMFNGLAVGLALAVV